MLFTAPALDADELRVVGEIDDFRRRFRHHLGEPRRWKGQLRRNLKARAIRGSNSIEGYDVTLDDAVALLEDEEPLDADRLTSLEIIGYRNALTYIQQLADDEHANLDESLLRSLHFMMLGHDLSKSPGQYRRKSIYVHDEESDRVVYEGPEGDEVPGLMAELTESLCKSKDNPVHVDAALGHLNLVMIHPFRDGNGRMARALQTLILAREGILSPEFSSIEEWLGRNINAYYDVLAYVGDGSWHPERDTKRWIRFNLVAHHMQAQTVLRRISETSEIWTRLDSLLAERRLPDRATSVLYDAAIGYRVRRTTYERDADLEIGTASRDLRMMVAAGLLIPHGETRGRTYVAGDPVVAIRRQAARNRQPLSNPFESNQPHTDKRPRRSVVTLDQ